MLKKAESNNAIFVRIKNVRPHSNADRLKLATVLGTQVIVGLDAQEDDLMIYFDSNISLSATYLKKNNLYSDPERNEDTTVKGSFGRNGRVKARRFRGEVSNGYVAEINSLLPFINQESISDLDSIAVHSREGVEFNTVNDTVICYKPVQKVKGKYSQYSGKAKPIRSSMFKKHFDTHQFMRENFKIPAFTTVYFEEKGHGTSGRTGNMLCSTNRPWWKFWTPEEEWSVLSGTRRVDHITYHIPDVRKEVEVKVREHLHKGEEIFYEILGYDYSGSPIQKGFTYGCQPGEYIVLLYRVTITTPDGFVYEMPREAVYKRAEELGLQAPKVVEVLHVDSEAELYALEEKVKELCQGKSLYTNDHIREGVVVWFEGAYGQYHALKHKSFEFLMLDSRNKDKGHEDIEDVL